MLEFLYLQLVLLFGSFPFIFLNRGQVSLPLEELLAVASAVDIHLPVLLLVFIPFFHQVPQSLHFVSFELLLDVFFIFIFFLSLSILMLIRKLLFLFLSIEPLGRYPNLLVLLIIVGFLERKGVGDLKLLVLVSVQGVLEDLLQVLRFRFHNLLRVRI
mmetsp:Transcript_23637/g.23349  ORF Transcript_23637/g.23349 Transcript_23637/m.23349 type:complete len:158 (+) Transcript_23637:1086-1559(+)